MSLPLRRYLAPSLVLMLVSTQSWSDQTFPAALAGHAVLPAQSMITSPTDAPSDLAFSGKFTTGSRVEQPGTVEGLSAGRPTGVYLPFKGQPLQGHSGIKKMSDGSYWLLTDNGAGAKANSPDFMLYLNRYNVNFGIPPNL